MRSHALRTSSSIAGESELHSVANIDVRTDLNAVRRRMKISPGSTATAAAAAAANTGDASIGRSAHGLLLSAIL